MTKKEFIENYGLTESHSKCCKYILESTQLSLGVFSTTNKKIDGKLCLTVDDDEYTMMFTNGSWDLLSFIIDNLLNDNKESMYSLLKSCRDLS